MCKLTYTLGIQVNNHLIKISYEYWAGAIGLVPAFYAKSGLIIN